MSENLSLKGAAVRKSVPERCWSRTEYHPTPVLKLRLSGSYTGEPEEWEATPHTPYELQRGRRMTGSAFQAMDVVATCDSSIPGEGFGEGRAADSSRPDPGG